MASLDNRTVNLQSLRIPREKFQRKGRAWWPWVLVALVVVGIGLKIATRAVEVQTTQVAAISATQASTVLTASGYIVARSKAEISPKAVGRVSWLNLEEGQHVKAGELVARLEANELQAQKREAEAELANARRELTRADELLAAKAGTVKRRDDARTDLEKREAQLRYIEEQIRNTEIYAPIDGVVTVKKAFVGETVTPQGFGAGTGGATFAVIVDLDSLEMEADINEQNLAKLTIGQPAEVALDAYPDAPYQAELRQIVPTADRQKGTVKVKVKLLSRDEKVLPEMSARVVFLKDRPQEGTYVTVPENAVVTVDGVRGVLEVTGGDAVFRPLQLGEKLGGDVLVTGGIGAGKTIVAQAALSDAPWSSTQRVKVKEGK